MHLAGGGSGINENRMFMGGTSRKREDWEVLFYKLKGSEWNGDLSSTPK